MNKFPLNDEKAQVLGYFSFMGPGEKTVFIAAGVLDNIINGYLVLTDKKLFFFFYSNITIDKKFIATYPFIVSVDVKEGLIYSTLTINNKKESIKIEKIKKKDAREFYSILSKIIKNNRK
ncbi:hypothetical protein ES705_00890 [subsurface metagenome]|jgi:hypothetical protein|uniref:YokE-like PH domain-containing protein n=2 Tax=marine sediment metagenome TaxID=412755 RepID=X0ZRL8_9ZZZZ|nr:hypothetical protein [Clostridia bacterium]TET14960.1 MAG: hypothetical protein E3J77_03345 [Actinomycetota bacterium]